MMRRVTVDVLGFSLLVCGNWRDRHELCDDLGVEVGDGGTRYTGIERRWVQSLVGWWTPSIGSS